MLFLCKLAAYLVSMRGMPTAAAAHVAAAADAAAMPLWRNGFTPFSAALGLRSRHPCGLRRPTIAAAVVSPGGS